MSQQQVNQQPNPQVKKKPGRPKLQNSNTKMSIEGISLTPANKEDCVELAYLNPKFFKKLFKIFKEYEISEINIVFDKTEVRFILKNDNVNIVFTMYGKHLHFYYCAQPKQVVVMRESLEKIMTCDKKDYKLTICLKDSNKSAMFIIIRDYEYESNDQYKIDVIPKEIYSDNVDETLSYPIKFTLSSKHFKKKINDIQKISPTLTIQKNGDEPIQFTFAEAKQINYNGIYANDEKIKLESTLNPNDVFLISVCIGYIKPYSNSVIGDDTIIRADQNKKLAFITMLDKRDGEYACCLQILTTTTSSQ
jgi:hypothetical protein